jgi:hypothetical protein
MALGRAGDNCCEAVGHNISSAVGVSSTSHTRLMSEYRVIFPKENIDT